MYQFKLILVMAIWGSVGIFSKGLSLDPVLTAFSRPIIALPILYLMSLKEESAEKSGFRAYKPYMLSGALLGLAWWTLLAAFDRIGIAIAILVYNMCPIYVMLLSPWLLKEAFRPIQLVKLAIALLGLIMVIAQAPSIGAFDSAGLACGLLSGFFYACIVLMNRKQQGKGLPVIKGTMVQMVSASLILLPVVMLGDPLDQLKSLNAIQWGMLATLGVVHTAIAYGLYFSVYKGLRAQTIAYTSYLEPVFGILFGVLLLGEPMSIGQLIGGLLILGILMVKEDRPAEKVEAASARPSPARDLTS